MIGHYPPGAHSGSTTQIGPGANREEDGFWWFLFEIQVGLPSDDTEPSDWIPYQTIIRAGRLTFNYDGKLDSVDISEHKDDSPNSDS